MLGLVLPRSSAAVLVTTADLEDIQTQIEEFIKSVEEVMVEIQKTVETAREVTDVGSLMNEVFDIGFLIPKPKMSTDVVETIPKEGEKKDGGITGSASSAASSVGLGGDSKGDSEKFEDASKVNQSVKKNLTVSNESGEQEEDSDDGVMGLVKDVAASITGAGTGQGPKAEEVTKKRAQLLQSKQAFARYALSAALVHRTLAHRTVEESRDNTEEKVGEARSHRKTHSAKVHSNLMMADTYNRLLMSQAAANGLSAFTVREEMESKIDYNLRGVTDGIGLGGGMMGGALGGIGQMGGLIGM